jgi:HK97 family phage major capsid protein
MGNARPHRRSAATVPSDGGYLIQKDLLTEIITRMNDFGQIKNRVRTIPIGPDSDGLKIFAVDETSTRHRLPLGRRASVLGC